MNATNADRVDFLFIKAVTIFPPIEYACLSPHVEKLGLKVAIIDLVVDAIGRIAIGISLMSWRIIKTPGRF